MEVVRQLLNQGTSVDFAREDGCTPLCFTVQDGHVDAVRELLIHGASVNFADKKG
jgi:ankyrin repeat protein